MKGMISIRGWCLILIFVWHVCMGALAFEPEWESEYFNPNPALDGNDLVLPLPGGGAMTFRPVIIVQDDLTGVKKFTLGNNDEEFYPDEYPRDGYISGVFKKDGNKRVYYMGKYEVTESQYDTVMKKGTPGKLSGNPKVNVSWMDASYFCHEWNLWLLQFHSDLLPKDGHAPGYIRLPTEEEWEFACRGGEMVNADLFYRDNFIPDGETENIKDYLQYFRAGEITRPQPIGTTRNPNHLGLFDMLGNVSEICFDVYRLNHHYGRSGGYVVRGGDIYIYKQNPKNIRSSIRTEIPFYDEKHAAPNRGELKGFRVVITAPFNTGLKRIDDIIKEWKKDRLPEKGPLRITFENAVKNIDSVYDKVKDTDLQKQLKTIKNNYSDFIQQIREIESADAESFFRIGAHSAKNIRKNTAVVSYNNQIMEKYRKDMNQSSTKLTDMTFIKGLERKNDELLKIIMDDMVIYGDTIENLHEKYINSTDSSDSSNLISVACEKVIERKKLQKEQFQISSLMLMMKHIRDHKQRDIEKWLSDIQQLPF